MRRRYVEEEDAEVEEAGGQSAVSHCSGKFTIYHW
jgi:hypothetical protein